MRLSPDTPAPDMPAPAERPLRHGAVAILNAAALVRARQDLHETDADPGADRDRRIAAARVLVLRGGPNDRARGALALRALGVS